MKSVYYTMAYSFAEDGDMVFQQNDLIRVYREFAAGPQGIVLKINEEQNTIVFAKAFLYSMAAAPFVKLFGTNGFFIFHGVLLWLNLLCRISLLHFHNEAIYSCNVFFLLFPGQCVSYLHVLDDS